jgi:hypothetical protein
LDSLLQPQEHVRAAASGGQEAKSEPSPLDQLRTLFVERLIPVVDTVNARYGDRAISVSMDASDFINGRRGIVIDIHYQQHRIHLEGTVMPDAIAFHETRYISNLGGTVAAGPMLRTRNLNENAFADFLYERIITLVKSANR